MVQQANDKANLLHIDDMIDETPNKSMDDGARPSSNRKSSARKHATNSTDQKKTGTKDTN